MANLTLQTQTLPSSHPRKRPIKHLLLFVLTLLALLPATAQVKQAYYPNLNQLREIQKLAIEVIESRRPSTVSIFTDNGSGSGVIVSTDGIILSAAHVVMHSELVTIVFTDGTEAKADVLGANLTRDIAMLKIRDPGIWPAAPIGKSSELDLGQWAIALGHAKGYDPNRPPPARFARILQNSKHGFLVTDCTLIGGDSGGPLFNLAGEVVGIHSSIGDNLAINNHAPIDAFTQNWQALLAGHRWGQLGAPPLSELNSPFLGIIATQDRKPGVIVEQTIPNGPAAKAGLKPNDRILQINQTPISDFSQLTREIAKFDPNDLITLRILRNQEIRQSTLRLAPKPAPR